MRVLMFGWEFPPFSSGGLGTACYGLTKGLNNQDIDVTFVLPKSFPDMKADFVKLVPASGPGVTIAINSPIIGYMTSEEFDEKILSWKKSKKSSSIYGKNLFEEVLRYAKKGAIIARQESHDIIHAHDWMTYKAGIEAKKASGKPFVIHVHATEFDRTGGNGVNQFVYNTEKEGMDAADKIMAVSQFTKDKIINHYGIDPDKITVVHNAVEFNDKDYRHESFKIKETDKIVLFLGRVTMQKGPDYFLHAAKKTLEIDPNIKFIIAGSGDMLGQTIEQAAELGIADKILFTGFINPYEVDRMYQMADLYVMPSISEPFGITPLEAMRNNTPVLISKQSGVSEVINHCLKVDFWDIEQMANKMLGVLKYEEVSNNLKHHGSIEIKKFDWDNPAKKCVDVYNQTIGEFNG
ncbi:glycosyltransferase family 4 protein [Candidatus Woesearchaeota archaeon]|nr:glycosyltransferase family 4 protein [Candidatus Woesearchaeota archaeon]